jgi:Chaperone of endosialidase
MFRILFVLQFVLQLTAYGQTSQSTLEAAKAATQSFSKVKNQTSNANISICVNNAGTEKCGLTVEGTTGTAIIGTTTNATVKANGTNTDLTLEAVGSGGAVVFKANGAERGRVDQNGTIKIGAVTTVGNGFRAGQFHSADNSSTETVLIDNRFATVNSSSRVLTLDFDVDSDATGGYFIYFRDADTSPMGSVTAASATTIAFNTSSDARLKYDIKPIKNALKRTLQLNPSSFKWKQDGHFDEGFIAQNVKKVYPTAVHGSELNDPKTDPMQVDYGKLTPLLAAAIKELAEENRQLKARLDAAGL